MGPRRAGRVTVGMLLALLLHGAGSFAAPPGSLSGTVVGPNGEPLPGVTVTLSGFGDRRIVRVTDAKGEFRFLDVPPGRGSLKAELEGFGTVDYPAVRIHHAAEVTLRVTLSPSFEDEIRLAAESPLLDERRIGTGTTVSDIELEKIPTARDPWAVLQSTPGVLVDRVGSDGRPARIQGVDPGRNVYIVDGIVGADLGAGDLPLDALRGFGDFVQEVRTGGFEAEYGGALGGVVNVITKSGGSEFRGRMHAARDVLWGDYFQVDPSRSFAGGEFQVHIESGSDGAACHDGFELRGPGGEPIGGSDPSAGGFAFAFDPPLRFTGRGDGSRIDLDGDGTAETRLFFLPSCGEGPDFTLIDYDALLGGAPTHLFVGADGIVPVDLGAILPGTPKRRIETAWDADGPTEIWKIEDTHVFSSSFYLNGLYSYVDGGFRVAPQSGTSAPAGDGFGMFGYGSAGLGPGEGRRAEPIDANGDGVGDTFFIQLSDLWNPCPSLTGGFFTIDGIGGGGGTLTSDPTFGDVPCRDFESVSLTFNRRLANRWMLRGNTTYQDWDWDLGTGPSSVDFVPGGSRSGFDVGDPGYTIGGPILKDKLWIWGTYGRTEATHLLLNGQGATPFDASRTGLPEGRHRGTGSFFLPGDRALDFSETNELEWETISPRVGITYALGEERKTLLRASYSRFAEQLGTGLGVGDPNPLGYAFTDPGRSYGGGVLGQGGFVVGGFGYGDPANGGPGPGNGEDRPAGGTFVDLDGDGSPETLILDFGDFFPDACPGFGGPIGGFLPTDGGGLRPIRPTAEDCDAFGSFYGAFQDEFRVGRGWYTLSAGLDDEDDRRDPRDLRTARYTGVLTPNLFAELQYNEKEFTFGSVLDAPPARGIQDMGVEFFRGFQGEYAPGGGAPGDGPRSADRPGDDPYPLLHFVARGGSTGEVMDVRIVHPPGEAVPIEGFVAIEPVAASASDRERWEAELSGLEGETERRTLSAYCLQYAAQAPPAGTVFRVAGPEKQRAFAPKARVLESARRLHEAGLLNPDTDPESYFHSIRQWSVWTREKGFDADGFMEAFVEHTKKNVEAAGRAWSGEIEEIVRTSARGRWRDVTRVLQETTP